MTYTPRQNTRKAIPCLECRNPFQPRRHDQKFCGRDCQSTADNRAMIRGRLVYRELYYWAASNGRGEMAKLIGDVSRMARKWAAEDKANGVSPPPIPERIAMERANANYDLRMVEVRRLLNERNAA